MSTITTRTGKGSTLTYAELDANFTNLNTDKLENTDVTSGNGISVTVDTAGDVVVATDSTADVTFNTVTATDEFIGHLDGSVRFTGRNTTGGTISPGEVVYINGISGNTPTVDYARANSSSTMPAFGIAIESINNNASGQFATFGSQRGLDEADYQEGSISFSVGDVLYVSASEAGKLTNVKPSGATELIQNIGKIERASPTTNQTIKVGGAGRTNDTPNTIDIPGSISASTASFTNTTTDDTILLTTTEDSSTAAPVLTFKRNSASPANGDYLGQLKFKGENDADQEVVYAKVTAKISDDTDTTEDGILEFANRKAGSNNIGMRLTSTELKLLNGTRQSIDATPGSFTNPLLLLKSNTSGYDKSQIRLEDSNDVVADITGRKNSGNGRFQYFITLDPDGGENRTGAFQGDYAYYIQRTPSTGNIDVDIYGATNEHNYSVFSDAADSYAYKPFNLTGSEVRLKSSGSTKLTVGSSTTTSNNILDMDGNNIKMDGGTIDLEGGSITSTGGAIDFADNTSVTLNSGGTVSFNVTNTSATGLGIRTTVGTPTTAVHSSGTLLNLRRATSSGYQTVLKAESTSTAAGDAIITMSNIDALTNQDTGTPSDTGTPTGYIELLINGTQRFIPYYT